MADTKADTKRYDFDASVDSVATEIITNSSRVGWSGRPFTPATGVQIPLGRQLDNNAVRNPDGIFYAGMNGWLLFHRRSLKTLFAGPGLNFLFLSSSN